MAASLFFLCRASERLCSSSSPRYVCTHQDTGSSTELINCVLNVVEST